MMMIDGSFRPVTSGEPHLLHFLPRTVVDVTGTSLASTRPTLLFMGYSPGWEASGSHIHWFRCNQQFTK